MSALVATHVRSSLLSISQEKTVRVQINLERYGKLREDIHDQLVADSRAREKSVPFEVVKRRLERRKRATRA